MARVTPDNVDRNEREAYFASARERFRERVRIQGAANAFRAGQIACGCDGCECALPAVEGGSVEAPSVAVAGVRFRDSGRTYYVDPARHDLLVGQHVIVDTSRGLELAQVVITPQQMIAATLAGELRPIARVATVADLELAESKRAEQGQALRVFAAKARDHGLPMKPISAEFSFDGSRLNISFSASGRVDFRDLVRDLARHFGCRIELRQVGARDEARLLGGLGRCGRPLCCSTWLPQFADVSMTMAKTQDLTFNPGKVSGVCGKLLCCLSYENEQYQESRSRLPRLGQEVMTEAGPGHVHALQILKETVTIRLETGEDVTLDPGELTVVGRPVDASGRGRRRRPRRDSAAPEATS
ncbi:MAG TPA: regulatory iron-sulfur-containing complex subunit RicT [Thermomicrobiales bacterium]|nr:regulatory iron-sulfur-containing complex subunit RicT [Thermomicrobiales bacterium]